MIRTEPPHRDGRDSIRRAGLRPDRAGSSRASRQSGRRTRLRRHRRHRDQARLDGAGRPLLDQCADARRHSARQCLDDRGHQPQCRRLAVQNLGRARARCRSAAFRPGRSCATSRGQSRSASTSTNRHLACRCSRPDIELFDLNRVETLARPQGTLFGSDRSAARCATSPPAQARYDRSWFEGNLNLVEESDVAATSRALSTCHWVIPRRCALVGYYRNSAASSTPKSGRRQER